jgi:hypothetical protein
MGLSLKEQLAARPDAMQRDYPLTTIEKKDGVAVVITVRRMLISEREELMRKYHLGDEAGAIEDRIAATIAIVARALVPPISEEEVRALPAAVIDEVALLIQDFNGWTKRGKAELDDQFRHSA